MSLVLIIISLGNLYRLVKAIGYMRNIPMVDNN